MSRASTLAWDVASAPEGDACRGQSPDQTPVDLMVRKLLAAAAQDFPSRPLRLYVGFTTGTWIDSVADARKFFDTQYEAIGRVVKEAGIGTE